MIDWRRIPLSLRLFKVLMARPPQVRRQPMPQPTMMMRLPSKRDKLGPRSRHRPGQDPTFSTINRKPARVIPAGKRLTWRDAALKITNQILEAYLNCKTKGHLKLVSESSTKSDYEVMTEAASLVSRDVSLARLVARYGVGNTYRGSAITAATLKQGAPLLVDTTLEDDGFLICLDALKRADGASKLGEYHYLPVLHNQGDKLGPPRKLLLAVLGLVLARVQGVRPAVGLVARGPDGRLGKICLDARLYRHAEQVLDEVKRLEEGSGPPLRLNRHCHLCEFRQRCRSGGGRERRHQPVGNRWREGTAETKPQGHLYPDPAVLHLPPAKERQAGKANGLLSATMRCRHWPFAKRKSISSAHLTCRMGRSRSSSTRRAVRTADSPTCWVCSSSRATLRRCTLFGRIRRTRRRRHSMPS